MRKTKIICTLGPSTDKEGVLRDLIANGMNVARFNFSHDTHENHLKRYQEVCRLRDELGLPAGGRDSDGMPGTLQCVSGCVCIYDDCGGG